MASNIGDTQSYLLIFLFLWLISILILQIIIKKTTKPTLHHLPPSPPALPLIGHLQYFLGPVALIKCFHNLSLQYGPFFYLHLDSLPILVVSSSSFVAEIYKTNDLTFSFRPKTPFDEGLLFQNFGFINSPYGDYWIFMKKLCVTKLLGQRQIERSRGVRGEELKHLLHKMIEKSTKNESVNLGSELIILSNSIICKMVMSTRCYEDDEEAQRCKDLVVGAMELHSGKVALATLFGPFKKLGFWVFRKQLKDIPRKFDELLEKILKEHEDRAKRDGSEREEDDEDFMDILLRVHHDENAEFKMSRIHIKAFIMDLFLAGTHTSAEAVEWVMAELINHPNVFKKLREEIESVIGTNNRLVDESDIPNLHYLQAVVKETLRLYPIGALIIRQSIEDCKIGEFDIPKKTRVLINLYSIMRDPEIWEKPNEFNPERFLVDQNEIIKKSQNYYNFNYVPFGGGRRMCPGSHLALSVIHITVASMVQCFDWKVADGHGDGGKVNMELKSGMIMSLAHPLMCLPVLHFNPFAVN